MENMEQKIQELLDKWFDENSDVKSDYDQYQNWVGDYTAIEDIDLKKYDLRDKILELFKNSKP